MSWNDPNNRRKADMSRTIYNPVAELEKREMETLMEQRQRRYEKVMLEERREREARERSEREARERREREQRNQQQRR